MSRRKDAMMKTLILMTTALALMTLPTVPAAAQQPTQAEVDRYVDLVRMDVRQGRAELVGETMQLSAGQATMFWPIYEEYEAAYTALGDTELQLIRDYAAVFFSMTDAAADGLVEAARLTALRDSLIEVVQRELAQTQERGEFAKTQLKQSSRELRRERRDVRGARDAVDDNQDLAELDLARNTLNRSDERRDREDDVQDLKAVGAKGQQLGAVLAQLTAAESETADAPTSPVELHSKLKTAVVTIDQVLVTDLEASTTELQELVKELEEDQRERRGDRRQRRRQ